MSVQPQRLNVNRGKKPKLHVTIKIFAPTVSRRNSSLHWKCLASCSSSSLLHPPTMVLLRKQYYPKTSYDHVYVLELLAKIRKFVEGENKRMRYIYLLTTRVHKYQKNLTMEVVDFLLLEVFNPKLSPKRNHNKAKKIFFFRKAGSRIST